MYGLAHGAVSTPQPRQAWDAGQEYTLDRCSSQTPPLVRAHPWITHKHLILRHAVQDQQWEWCKPYIWKLKGEENEKKKKYCGRESHMASFLWFYLKVCSELLHQWQTLDNTEAWSLILTSITGTVWPNHMLTQAVCTTGEEEGRRKGSLWSATQ